MDDGRWTADDGRRTADDGRRTMDGGRRTTGFVCGGVAARLRREFGRAWVEWCAADHEISCLFYPSVFNLFSTGGAWFGSRLMLEKRV
jgi:hypothetical protein